MVIYYKLRLNIEKNLGMLIERRSGCKLLEAEACSDLVHMSIEIPRSIASLPTSASPHHWLWISATFRLYCRVPSIWLCRDFYRWCFRCWWLPYCGKISKPTGLSSGWWSSPLRGGLSGSCKTMRKFLIATHGTMASGIQNALQIITGIRNNWRWSMHLPDPKIQVILFKPIFKN